MCVCVCVCVYIYIIYMYINVCGGRGSIGVVLGVCFGMTLGVEWGGLGKVGVV